MPVSTLTNILLGIVDMACNAKTHVLDSLRSEHLQSQTVEIDFTDQPRGQFLVDASWSLSYYSKSISP
jgi:hypothetical protein